METQAESKKHRKTDRPMTTPIFLLRCVQIGLSLSELDLLTIGVVNDMFTEKENENMTAGRRSLGRRILIHFDN